MAARKFSGALSVLISIAIIAEFFTVSMAYNIIPLGISVKAAETDISSDTSVLSRLDTQKEKLLLYENEVIRIFNYSQLLLIGTGRALTDSDGHEELIGTGSTVYDNGKPITYSLDGKYEIAEDISIPRHTIYRLPDDFTGSICGKSDGDRALYDNPSDTIYIYNPYQLSVMAMDDADVQPVLSGDSEARTFGTGQPVMRDENCSTILTYSSEHNYVISVRFDSDDTQKPVSVITDKSDAEKSSPGALRSVSPQLAGRDFAGQVIKKIDGVTYILIGNESQLRAIGTDAEVFTAVYQTDYVAFIGHVLDTDQNGDPIQLYGGDADLLSSQNGYRDYGFQQISDKT